MTDLTPHGIAVLVFAGLVFATFIHDRLPIATVCLGILALLPTGFALFPLHTGDQSVDPMRFFAGFGHPALIAICALMVLGQGIVVTGALEPLARTLAGWVAARPRLALLAVLLGAARRERGRQRHAGGRPDDPAAAGGGAARQGTGGGDAAADELRGADRRHVDRRSAPRPT